MIGYRNSMAMKWLIPFSIPILKIKEKKRKIHDRPIKEAQKVFYIYII